MAVVVDTPLLPEILTSDPVELTLPIAMKIEKPDREALHRIYEVVSKNIERENALINFRIMWAIVLSGGILAAEGVIINYIAEYYATNTPVHQAGQAAVVFLSFLAIVFCWMSWLGVDAALKQLDHIKLSFKYYRSAFGTLGYPRPFGRKRGHRWGNFNAITYTSALTVLWILFFGAQIYRLYDLLFHPAELEKVFSETRRNNSNEDLIKAINDVSLKLDTLITHMAK